MLKVLHLTLSITLLFIPILNAQAKTPTIALTAATIGTGTASLGMAIKMYIQECDSNKITPTIGGFFTYLHNTVMHTLNRKTRHLSTLQEQRLSLSLLTTSLLAGSSIISSRYNQATEKADAKKQVAQLAEKKALLEKKATELALKNNTAITQKYFQQLKAFALEQKAKREKAVQEKKRNEQLQEEERKEEARKEQLLQKATDLETANQNILWANAFKKFKAYAAQSVERKNALSC